MAGGKAQRAVSSSEILQEGRHALIRVQCPQRQHPVLVAAQFLCERLGQSPLQRHHRRTRVEHRRIGQFDDLAVVERDYVNRVMAAADRLHTDQLPAHRKTGHLLAPVRGGDTSAQEAGMDQEQRPERLAGAVHVLAAPHAAAHYRHLSGQRGDVGRIRNEARPRHGIRSESGGSRGGHGSSRSAAGALATGASLRTGDHGTTTSRQR